MFKKKIIFISIIFAVLLIFTSVIKNKTRIIEKKITNLNTIILLKAKDINETQLDFQYLTSPTEIEKKIDIIGINNYKPIKYSNIFFDIADFSKIQNRISNLKILNEKKIQKK
tara:strand:+ start:323 stop:661 length:339 start_codon:yes stop_codon:yes gene_type:complete